MLVFFAFRFSRFAFCFLLFPFPFLLLAIRYLLFAFRFSLFAFRFLLFAISKIILTEKILGPPIQTTERISMKNIPETKYFQNDLFLVIFHLTCKLTIFLKGL